MKIYTGKGDTGKTSVVSGEEVLKDSTVIETIGNIDELNAVIGLNISICKHVEIKNILHLIQSNLFIMGSEIACYKMQKDHNIRISDKDIKTIENHIDTINSLIPELTKFIFPGGSHLASNLHIARTVCRRVERVMVRCLAENKMETYMLVYLNRLSDLLFVLARYANLLDEHPEVVWANKK
jgi:cob(I)alamin adenosyltransferase